MPIYHRLGQLPPKRHTTFFKPDGNLYYEQLFGTEGFHGTSSLLYHVHRPTQVKAILGQRSVAPKIAHAKTLKSLRLKGFQVAPEADYLDSRKTIFCNNDLHISLAAPQNSLTDYHYKNADADELIFVHKGSGVLKTLLGNIPFEYGDYLVVPRGMIYQIHFNDADNRLFIVESFSPIFTPKRYKNSVGQHLEHAPFCERDFKLPQDLETFDQKGDFLMKIKKQQELYDFVYASHPFDVVGWDGYNYPWGISIHNFEPITGRVHQPPPVHQQFEAHNFVVCSFCPRLYDYHPKSIPAPYNHSNIDSDELLYYVDGDFMSRNDVAPGHISFHPGGIPHGPHPGAYERSIGKTQTDELAVMVDTFRPLMVTEEAMRIDDGRYFQSWLE
jgi:homogentisate 1,2-dioxygenase